MLKMWQAKVNFAINEMTSLFFLVILRGSAASIENYEWVRPLLQYLIKCIKLEGGIMEKVLLSRFSIRILGGIQGIKKWNIYKYWRSSLLVNSFPVICGESIYIGSEKELVQAHNRNNYPPSICNSILNVRQNLGPCRRDFPIHGA